MWSRPVTPAPDGGSHSRMSSAGGNLMASIILWEREGRRNRKIWRAFRLPLTMHQLLTDLRSGVRMLFKYPTLSIVSVVTLGLGIGLSTTVFCVVNGGLFKGLPFPDADRIVSLVGTNPSQSQPRLPISAQDLAIWQARQTSFEKL